MMKTRPLVGLTPHWSWALGLGVVLVAMAVFYVTLTDLVRESAARAPRLPPSIMPAHVQQPAPTDDAAPTVARAAGAVAPRGASFAAVHATPVAHHAPVDRAPPVKAERKLVEVHKCLMPEGAMYSDGPCPEGAASSTLRLPSATTATAHL